MQTQSKKNLQKLVIISGATSTGKTAASLRLAAKASFEIINADSMQIYRYMDIGTSKPSESQIKAVPHHLVSIVDPDEYFSAADYMKIGRETIEDIAGRKKFPLVVGGTGLYIKALTRGLLSSPGSDKNFRQSLEKKSMEELFDELKNIDPLQAQKIKPGDRRRTVRALEVFHLTGKTISSLQSEHNFSDTPYNCLKIGLYLERELLYKKIDLRVDEMIEQGFIEEVKNLLSMGYSPELRPMQSIGYCQMAEHIKGTLTLDGAVSSTKQQTRRYAKRQMTWFRNDPEILWLNADKSFDMLESEVKNFLNNC